MKVLVVDDEMVVRVGIKSIIDWEKIGFELVGEASNGVAAFQLIEQTRPDIVIIDIKMPEMDGLELIRRVKEAGYPIKFIVLSSYNEFDLVKQAMKLGASDYLLKMKMTSDSLQEVLYQAKQQITSEQTHTSGNILHSDISKNLIFLRQNLLRDFLFHENQGNMFYELKNALNIKLDPNCLCCMGIRLTRTGISGKTRPSGIIRSSMINIIEEIINDRFRGHCVDLHDGELCVFLSPLNEDSGIQRSTLDELGQVLCEMLKKYLNVDISIGIGIAVTSIDQIRYSYDCAKTALFLSEIDGNNRPVNFVDFEGFPCISDFIASIDNSHIVNSLCDTLLRISANFEMSEMLNMVTALSESAPKGSQPGMEDFPFVVQVYISILRYFRSCNIDISNVLTTSSRTTEQIRQINSCKKVKDWLECMMDDLSRYFDVSKDGAYPHSIKVAIQYIKKNYYRDIPIKEIADFVNLSPSYLGNIFRQYVGTSLVNYIARIRIKNAKELLSNSNYKVYEVSQMVGYTNSYYFNRIFKKLTGMTPLEYKNSKGIS